jgi:hypothetical protein
MRHSEFKPGDRVYYYYHDGIEPQIVCCTVIRVNRVSTTVTRDHWPEPIRITGILREIDWEG